MNLELKRVAVLGAGTMGAQIAAHLANVGVPALLLDLKREGDDPSALARQAVQRMLKMRPAPFFVPENAALIEVGNFEDDLEKVAGCDWVIEAIAEKLDWKRDLWRRVAPLRRADAIVSTNTSGLPLAQIAEGFPAEFQRYWVGTHFFTPPRYMKLLEVIPGEQTLPEVIEAVSALGDRLLGKGVVLAKDTPNFIANRIGTFAAGRAMALREEVGLTIEEVDLLTGPAIGRPKTGTYRLGDLVGIDVLMHVGQNLYDNLNGDPFKSTFLPDELMKRLVASGATGRKAGRGFYKKEGKEILVVDPETLEYRQQQEPRLPGLAEVRNDPDPVSRVRRLLESDGRESRFLWPLLRDSFAYTAGRIPEISDDVYAVDRALRWGFGWDLGNFELWDGLGAAEVVERSRRDGVEFPEWIDRVLESGSGFYGMGERGPLYFDLQASALRPLPEEPGKVRLDVLKKLEGTVLTCPDASLLDLGDGVACLEYHSKMNSLGPAIVEFSARALDEVSRNFEGMVIGNQGANFSVGANLVFLLQAASQGLWEELQQAVAAFQTLTQSFRFSPKPVVAAPVGRTLAGGCEVVLGADAVVAAAETYMGLVEVGVGLIPAGGGTKEVLMRATAQYGQDLRSDRMQGVRKAFETLGMAKVSSSAEEARRLDLLTATDAIEIQSDRLIHRAKQKVLALAAAGYRQPRPRPDVAVVGGPGLAVLEVGLHLMHRAGYVSDHDKLIGQKLCHVLTGGDINHATYVSEEYLLQLEREAFLSLCGEEKTHQRIEAMLKTGKPLRN